MYWSCPTATPPRRWRPRPSTASACPRSPNWSATPWPHEDDAEDAQWLVVIEDPQEKLDSASLDDLMRRLRRVVGGSLSPAPAPSGLVDDLDVQLDLDARTDRRDPVGQQ